MLGDDTTAAAPHDIVIDRVYAHGDFYKGMKRGISLNSERTDILNSYISDIKAVNADSQAIAGYNGKGPFRIINNYLEGAGENVIFGGSDPAVTNLVPSDIEVRGNHLFKPLSWRDADPAARRGSPRASAATSGSLSAGTHYFKVIALMDTDNRTAVSLPSAEVSATVSARRGGVADLEPGAGCRPVSDLSRHVGRRRVEIPDDAVRRRPRSRTPARPRRRPRRRRPARNGPSRTSSS